MNREFAKEALDKLLSIATKAGEIAMREIPPTLEQLLQWKLAQNLLLIIFCIIGLGAIYKYLQFTKKIDFDKGPEDVPSVIILIGGGVATFFTVFGIIAILPKSINNVLQIWLAPRIYLIEYLREFVK